MECNYGYQYENDINKCIWSYYSIPPAPPSTNTPPMEIPPSSIIEAWWCPDKVN